MIDYHIFELDNGLRVAHYCDPSVATVTLNILYATGSRDESPERTGIAHLFEHLMFGGSTNVKDFSACISSAGGYDNAWTSNDFTNFYEVISADNVATAFWAESDRMISPRYDEQTLAVQRNVVIEEFKQQCLNQPYGRMQHVLRRELYGGTHPYSWPVIGLDPSHIAAMTSDDARQWFFSHYGPNNAVLAVAGNITLEQTCQLAEEWFGSIPRREIAPRKLPEPKFPSENRTVHISDRVPYANITIAVPMPSYGAHDYFVCDTITDLLGSGQSSRMLRNLVIGGDGLFSHADAAISGSEHQGFLMLCGIITDSSDKAIAHAHELLLGEARRLSIVGDVSPRELQRCMNNFEARHNRTNLNCNEIAEHLAMAVYHGENINDAPARQRQTTLADISRVANQLFNNTPLVTIICHPESSDTDIEQ